MLVRSGSLGRPCFGLMTRYGHRACACLLFQTASLALIWLALVPGLIRCCREAATAPRGCCCALLWCWCSHDFNYWN